MEQATVTETGGADADRPLPIGRGRWQKFVEGRVDWILEYNTPWDSAELPKPGPFAKVAVDNPARSAQEIKDIWSEMTSRADGATLTAGFVGTVTAFLADRASDFVVVGVLCGAAVVLTFALLARDVRLAAGPPGWVPSADDFEAAMRALRRKEAFTRSASFFSVALLFVSARLVISLVV